MNEDPWAEENLMSVEEAERFYPLPARCWSTMAESQERCDAMKLLIWNTWKHTLARCKFCGGRIKFLEQITKKVLKTKIKHTRKLIPVTVKKGSLYARPWHRTYKGVNGRLKHIRHTCAEERQQR